MKRQRRRGLWPTTVAVLALAGKWFLGNYLYGLSGGALGALLAAVLKGVGAVANTYLLVALILLGAAAGLAKGNVVLKLLRSFANESGPAIGEEPLLPIYGMPGAVDIGPAPNPQLHIEFDRAATGTELLTMKDGRQVGYAKYFNCCVSADALVRNCRGRLVELERRDAFGDFVHVPGFKNVDLRWDTTQANFMRVDVVPGEPERLNIVNGELNEAGYSHNLLCVDSYEPGKGVSTLSPGVYRLTVRVAPETEPLAYAEAQFLVKATAAWNELEVSAV